MEKKVLEENLKHFKKEKYNHPYVGLVAGGTLFVSTSIGLVSDVHSVVGDKYESAHETFIYSNSEDEIDFELRPAKYKFVAEHKVCAPNCLDGLIEDIALIYTDDKQLLLDAVTQIKNNYINKYSRHQSLRSFRPDQVCLNVNEFSVDGKVILTDVSLNTKKMIANIEKIINNLISYNESISNQTNQVWQEEGTYLGEQE